MLTYKRLTQVLKYDPTTGKLTWLKTLSFRSVAGSLAGGVKHTDGGRTYITVGIDGRHYLAHRLAWLYVHKRWPALCIDHIDGDGTNNKLVNLREATHSQNLANQKKKIKSSTGVRGVYPYSCTGKKFEARGMKDYKNHHFGIYSSIDDARRAYENGMKKLFGEFSSTV